MKNYLAIDTSGDSLTLLLKKDGKRFETHLPDCMMKHSVKLMTEVDSLLKRAEFSLENCDFFACAVGPGSFTGIRIGISAVKGFCLAFQKPALSVTSFEIMAYNALEEGKILCLVDALHDSYYAAGYKNGELVLEPAYLSEEEVLQKQAEGYTLVSTAHLPVYEKTDGKIVSLTEGFFKAVEAKSEQNEYGALTALYVRKSSAELNLGK